MLSTFEVAGRVKTWCYCNFNNLEFWFVLQVAWIKSDTKAILAIHTHMVAQNARLSVTHNGHNTWKLHISNVQNNDSGTYMCQINTDPMRSQVCDIYYFISYNKIAFFKKINISFRPFAREPRKWETCSMTTKSSCIKSCI